MISTAIHKFFVSMKTHFSRRTIRFELMAALLFAALLPAIIINIYYFSKMNTFIEDKVKSYNEEIIRQTGEKLDSLISYVEIIKRQLISTAITSQLFVNYDEKTSMEKLGMVKETETLLGDMKRSFPAISDVYMIGVDGMVFSTNLTVDSMSLLQKNWIKSINNRVYGDENVPTHNADYSNINKNSAENLVVSFTKKITGYGNNNAIGIIQIDLKYSEIKKIIESVSLDEQAMTILADSNNRVIYCEDERYLGKSLEEVELNGFNARNTGGFKTASDPSKAFIVDYTVAGTGWKVIGIIPTESTLIQAEQVSRVFFLIVFILILFSFFASYVLSSGITKPITRITKVMKRVGEGEFDMAVPGSNNRDIKVLSDSFNLMVNKIDSLMNSVIQKEKEKTHAELKALQAQISPHFLYNTLNTIKWMAVMEKSDSIANAIVAVVKILEFSCKNSDKLIPIQAEIEFIENYLLIQKMRYGSSIEIKYEIDGSLYDLYTLKFILQPIVENAIIHGLSAKKYAGLITIRGRTGGDCVIFEVEDNGTGINNNQKEKFTGLGIRNIEERIKLHFGDRYGLNIASNCGEGTLVVVTIPMITEEEVG